MSLKFIYVTLDGATRLSVSVSLALSRGRPAILFLRVGGARGEPERVIMVAFRGEPSTMVLVAARRQNLARYPDARNPKLGWHYGGAK